jgi:hypothetical protein
MARVLHVLAHQHGIIAHVHAKNAVTIKLKMLKECVYAQHKIHLMMEQNAQYVLSTYLFGMDTPVLPALLIQTMT